MPKISIEVGKGTAREDQMSESDVHLVSDIHTLAGRRDLLYLVGEVVSKLCTDPDTPVGKFIGHPTEVHVAVKRVASRVAPPGKQWILVTGWARGPTTPHFDLLCAALDAKNTEEESFEGDSHSLSSDVSE